MDDQRRLAIEWECSRLIQLYANLNDEGRWQDLTALYAADGIMTRPTDPETPIVGRGAILSAFNARTPRTTRHICSNIVVTVEDDRRASAVSAMLLFTSREQPPHIGSFVDRFRLVDGEGWRFAERRGTLTF